MQFILFFYAIGECFSYAVCEGNDKGKSVQAVPTEGEAVDIDSLTDEDEAGDNGMANMHFSHVLTLCNVDKSTHGVVRQTKLNKLTVILHVTETTILTPD